MLTLKRYTNDAYAAKRQARMVDPSAERALPYPTVLPCASVVTAALPEFHLPTADARVVCYRVGYKHTTKGEGKP
jgi:hypothetical protein